MNTTAKAHEPTMEEILASIRRIISDDEPAASPAAKPAPAAKAAEEPVAGGLGQDDIDAMLASFDAVEPEPKPALKVEVKAQPTPEPRPKAVERPAPAPVEQVADDIDVLELTDDMADDMAAEMAAERAFQPEPSEPYAAPMRAPEPPAHRAPTAAPDSLLSAATDDAVTHAFGSLAHTILSNNARTIDDVVREMLRPMLRSWLDDNLPPLVERLVRAEIERVARGGR